MEPVTVGLIALGFLLLFLMAGFHIAVALMVMSIAGILLSTGNPNVAINILATTAFSTIREYMFGVIPLFVLMGLLANLSGASTELYNSANALLRRVKGGLAIATVVANAIFAAITGVSIASAAVFTKIAVPEMSRLGYDRKFAVGTVAGSSVLGMLIPPSILMIVYGMLAEQSIGKLFIAGVIPGIVLSAIYITGILVMGKLKPGIFGNGYADTTETKENLLVTIFRPWAIYLLVIVSLGGIWAGFFTPTEAGGVGAFGAFILVIAKGKFNRKTMWQTFLDAGLTTGAILFLIIAAQMYSRMLAISGFVNVLGQFVTGLSLPPMFIISIFILIFVALGCLLDSTSILLLTMPLMVPIVSAFKMDLIWFGILSIVAIETGLLTPPFGISVYTIKSSLSAALGEDKISLQEIFAGSMPYLYMMFLLIVMLMVFPQLCTWLPGLM